MGLLYGCWRISLGWRATPSDAYATETGQCRVNTPDAADLVFRFVNLLHGELRVTLTPRYFIFDGSVYQFGIRRRSAADSLRRELQSYDETGIFQRICSFVDFRQ